MNYFRLIWIISFCLVGCKMTPEKYANTRYQEIIKSSAKIITTKYYQGTMHDGKWICGREVEPGNDPDSYLLPSEEPTIKFFNEAGNIILMVKTNQDNPSSFVETQYISSDSPKMKFRRYVSRYGDSKEVFIRDSDGRLLKVKNGTEETSFEYNYNGQRIKTTTVDETGTTITKRLPGETPIYSVEVYQNYMRDNYRRGLKEERTEIYDIYNHLIEQRCKYYNKDGIQDATSQRIFKYDGEHILDEFYEMRSLNDSSQNNYFETCYSKYNSHGDIEREDFVMTRYSNKGDVMEFSRYYYYDYNSNGDWIQCCRIAKDYSVPPVRPDDRVTIIVREIIYK